MPHLILPGLHGSTEGHWQSWWLGAVPGSRFVEQKDWSSPTPLRWSAPVIREAVKGSAVIVAHSLGCALLAHVARERPDLPITGALLVAPADVDEGSWAGPGTAAFGSMPMARLPFPSIVVASRNDPYVSLGRALDFARAWGSDFVDLGEAGHINRSSGFGPWPEGVRLARGLAVSGSTDTRSHALEDFRAGAA